MKSSLKIKSKLQFKHIITSYYYTRKNGVWGEAPILLNYSSSYNYYKIKLHYTHTKNYLLYFLSRENNITWYITKNYDTTIIILFKSIS